MYDEIKHSYQPSPDTHDRGYTRPAEFHVDAVYRVPDSLHPKVRDEWLRNEDVINQVYAHSGASGVAVENVDDFPDPAGGYRIYRKHIIIYVRFSGLAKFAAWAHKNINVEQSTKIGLFGKFVARFILDDDDPERYREEASIFD